LGIDTNCILLNCFGGLNIVEDQDMKIRGRHFVK